MGIAKWWTEVNRRHDRSPVPDLKGDQAVETDRLPVPTDLRQVHPELHRGPSLLAKHAAEG